MQQRKNLEQILGMYPLELGLYNCITLFLSNTSHDLPWWIIAYNAQRIFYGPGNGSSSYFSGKFVGTLCAFIYCDIDFSINKIKEESGGLDFLFDTWNPSSIMDSFVFICHFSCKLHPHGFAMFYLIFVFAYILINYFTSPSLLVQASYGLIITTSINAPNLCFAESYGVIVNYSDPW